MMDLKQLFTDDNAVSPVIGVILMVAITVILAAVIGAFVLNIGGNQETAPQNQFDFEYSNNSDHVIVSHGGGGTLDATQLDLSGAWTGSDCGVVELSGLGAGDVVVNNSTGSWGPCSHDASSGDTLEITWTSSSGDTSQIITDSTVP
ncbi:type IV pilin [Haloarchaeobius litoreus]|uniref:Type IV pilin n=1 Tax=Haloarchaeobius litoreus TaxID=755306 RepID=A0ABD6DIG1_9EURY|nr:type IV pilin N-terminal domain-containing protein [Haloarchaeobius litoreus]